MAAGVELEPGLGVVIVAVGEREGGIAGRVRRQEAERPLGPRLVRISAGLVRPGRWCIVDVTREEDRTLLLLHQPHRVILVATLATEVHGVEALVRVAGEELLTIDRHVAYARRLDRRVGVAGARDELVEFEREETPLACVGVRGPYPLSDARHQKEVSQRPAAGSVGPTGVRRELGHCLGHRPGPGPDPVLVDLGERDTKTRLHPHRERVLPERRVGDVPRCSGINGLAKAGPHRSAVASNR